MKFAKRVSYKGIGYHFRDVNFEQIMIYDNYICFNNYGRRHKRKLYSGKYGSYIKYRGTRYYLLIELEDEFDNDINYKEILK